MFAAFSFIRNNKFHKARFGCLYTLLSVLCAIGATYSTSVIGRDEIQSCLNDSTDIFGDLASFVGCGILSLSLMIVAWFGVLIIFGGISLFLSRAKNQSWMDEEFEEDTALEISFDHL